MEELRADPDLKPVFDDIAASGAAGMDKYWNDGDLMTRISRKMAALGVSPEAAPQPPGKSIPVSSSCAFSSDLSMSTRMAALGVSPEATPQPPGKLSQ